MDIELVKTLRNKTNISLDVCKKALVESNGDIDAAIVILQKKGQLKANQLSDRPTSEGKIHSYIHNGRIGVMVEVGCNTDFSAKTKEFVGFCDAVAMQIASMNPKFISELSTQEEDYQIDIFKSQIKTKPPEEQFIKMIDGKLQSLKKELCLLYQDSVCEPGKTIENLRANLAAKIGENIVVKRFVRWEVGV